LLLIDILSEVMAHVIRCPQPGCDFSATAGHLCTARRTIRGHTLRVHSAAYVGEDIPPRPLSGAELDAALDRFRASQMNSTQRRNHSAFLLDALASVGAPGGSPPGVSPGLLAGSAQVRNRPGAAPGFPNLSAGQVAVGPPAAPPVADVAVQACAPFNPPHGWSPDRMVDFLMENPGRPPSSLLGMLTAADPSPDPWIEYMLQVAIGLQRASARLVVNTYQDRARLDPFEAMNGASAALARLAHRRLD